MITVPLTVTLTSPLHHGAGTAGNTARLRTQPVIQPDGTEAHVPFVSANSVRHGLRDALAWHLVRTIGVEDGSLTKGAVDLLWSGGAVTSTGAQNSLELARRIDAVLPSLAMLGYAAQSDIVAGTLRVSDLILVCTENAWRLPDDVPVTRRAAAYRAEEFGTRHDVAGTPVDRFVDTAKELTSTQMIYDAQVLVAGARLHGDVQLTAGATDAHRMCLGAALQLWAGDGVSLGARSAQGFGRGHLDIPAWCADALTDWTAHVAAHGADIVELVAAVAA